MNIKNLTVLVFALITTGTIAQNRLHFALKGGANYSGLHSGERSATYQIGFNAGAVVEFQFNETFALQTELLYNAKGAQFSVPDLEENQFLSIETEQNYFDIPLLVRFYPSERFSIDVGPQIGFLLDSKGEIDGEDVELTNVNKTDFAVNAGFTLNFENDVFIQARYSYGLNEVFENDSYKNAVISLSLGYNFYKIRYR